MKKKKIVTRTILVGICLVGLYIVNKTTEPHISEKIDYINKSGLDFNSYDYRDEEKGFYINYETLNEPGVSMESININIFVKHRHDELFKEELKIAMKSVGASDEEYEELIKKIEVYLTKEYQEIDSVAKSIKKVNAYSVDIADNSKYKITFNVHSVNSDYPFVGINLHNKDSLNYLSMSNLISSSGDYFDKESELLIIHDIYEDLVSIRLSIPSENIGNSKLREQLEIAIAAIGGTNEDMELIYSKLKSNDFKTSGEVIKKGRKYKIEIYSEEYPNDTFVTIKLSAGNMKSRHNNNM